jgi:GDPmannose 4,6-dehydratase
MRALVTGITGQDGSYLAERLIADGYEVHGLVHDGDHLRAELERLCPTVQLHEGDLRDLDQLRRVVAQADPDEVYNLAGVSSVAASWKDPLLTAEVNGLGAARLLQLAREHQDSRGSQVRFVQASSAEIFGNASGPQDESAPIRPTSPYGAAKAFAHHLVQTSRAAGLFAVSLIFFNHESPRRPPTFVTRKITQQVALIARGEASELELGNVHARRDWGWAPDYVDAMVRACRAGVADDYVIATGEAHSVQDFALAAFAAAGVDDGASYIRSSDEHTRPSDAAELVGDATKARTELGWAPTLSFAEIVARMVAADLGEGAPTAAVT